LKRIGIDVGGTNTDAVLLEDERVAHAVKTPTTADVTTGIERALGRLVEASGVDRGGIDAVMIGTTQGYDRNRPGFFVVPVDPASNNERCFVVAAATQEVSFV